MNSIIPLIELFFLFFKVGLFTFGGGYAMIPLIKQETISKNLITEVKFYEFVGISESTPGPFAINIATFIGYHNYGILGSLFATLGIVMPSFILIILIFKFLKKYLDKFYVKNALMFIQPVIIGFIFVAGINVLLKVSIIDKDLSIYDYKAIIIFLIAFVISSIKIKSKKISPIFIIIFSGLLGLLLYGVLW